MKVHKIIRLLAVTGLVATSIIVTEVITASASPQVTVFHACLKDGSLSNVRLYPVTCLKSQAVTWNSIGPEGPQGPSNDSDEQGPVQTVFTYWSGTGNFGGTIELNSGGWIVSNVLVGGLYGQCTLSTDIPFATVLADGMDYPQQNDQNSSDLVVVATNNVIIPFECTNVGGGGLKYSGVVMTAIPTTYYDPAGIGG